MPRKRKRVKNQKKLVDAKIDSFFEKDDSLKKPKDTPLAIAASPSPSTLSPTELAVVSSEQANHTKVPQLVAGQALLVTIMPTLDCLPDHNFDGFGQNQSKASQLVAGTQFPENRALSDPIQNGLYITRTTESVPPCPPFYCDTIHWRVGVPDDLRMTKQKLDWVVLDNIPLFEIPLLLPDLIQVCNPKCVLVVNNLDRLNNPVQTQRLTPLFGSHAERVGMIFRELMYQYGWKLLALPDAALVASTFVTTQPDKRVFLNSFMAVYSPVLFSSSS